MRRLIVPLGFVLAIPVVLAMSSAVARQRLEVRWTNVITRQFTAKGQWPSTSVVSRLSLPNLCRNPRTAAEYPPCRAYSATSTLVQVAWATAGAGLVLLGLLGVGGQVLASRRPMAVRLWRPMLIAAAGGIALLATAQSALLVFGHMVMGIAVEWWPSSFTLVLVGIALWWVVVMTRTALAIDRQVSLTVAGETVSLADHPRLRDALEQAANAAGTELPTNVVVGLMPGVFVTSADVVTLDGRRSGRTLYLSLASCRILDERECLALLTQEFAHDGGPVERRVVRALRPRCAAIRASMQALSNRARLWRTVAVRPAVATMSIVVDAVCRGELSPTDDEDVERDADVAAATFTGTETLGAALVKHQAFEPAWRTVLMGMGLAVSYGSQYDNASRVFAETVQRNGGTERLAGVAGMSSSHPFDRHRPLGTRLANLGLSVERVAGAALATAPTSPASAWFADVERLERQLSSVEHRLVAAAQGLYDSPKTA